MPHYPAVYPPGVPEPAVQDNRGNTYTASSLGVDLKPFGPGFRAHGLMKSERRLELEHRKSFYRCVQHDKKAHDFDGRLRPMGPAWTQPLIGGSLPTFYVPLRERRPLSPYRLARVIVQRFTSLLFGQGRFPKIRIVGDPDSQDFAEALVKALRLRMLMVRARNLGGACGTVGLSWAIYDGVARARAHSGENLHVHSWADREEHVPEHVTELYQFAEDEIEPGKKEVKRVLYWFRRDWTPNADVFFIPQKVEKGEPQWIIDGDNTVVHDDGQCHFVWIPNLPDDESGGIDGLPDYFGLDDNFGSLDILNSVTSKGASLNLDPTLKLKVDPDILKRGGIRKGSENALAVGEGGDASYLELSGTSITAGNSLIDRERGQILEVSQCIVPDPNTIAAAGTSSVALKLVFGPMLDQGDVLREQYGQGIERLIEQIITSVQRRMADPQVEVTYETDEAGNMIFDADTGEPVAQEQSIEYVILLPPRVVTKEIVDPATSQPTGEVSIELVERHPGEGGDAELEWPDYFRPTADDMQKTLTTLSTAAGGKPVISHRTAVEKAAALYEIDAVEEWKQVSEQMKADQEAAAALAAPMFPGIGGGQDEFGGGDVPPPGGELPPGQQPPPAGGALQ